MISRSFLILLLFFVPQTVNGPDQRFFRYERPLVLADSITKGQSCAPLDATVFAHAASDLSDLRLYNGVREVPYVISTFVAPNPAAYTQPELLNLGESRGHVVFDAHIFNPSYSSIEIDTKAQNFVASVDVSGGRSTDVRSYTHLGTFTIFDLTNQQLNRSTVLHLPPTNFQYLHFDIAGPLQPKDIVGITTLESSEYQQIYTTVAESHQITQRGRFSVISFDVPGYVPVERVELLPDSAGGNFNRGVSIGATFTQGTSPDSSGAHSIGAITRVHTVQNGVRVDEEQYALEISDLAMVATPKPVRWTVSVDNGDDVPIALKAVRLEMRERTLCFDATSNRGAYYTIYYGDSALSPPRYDYANLFRLENRPAQALLASEQPNPRFQPRPDMRPLSERYPILLWIALILVVASLGFIAVRSADKVARR